MTEENKKTLNIFLNDLNESFQDYDNELKSKIDSAWDSLDKNTQLLMFCAVISKLSKGELVDKGSYRYVLYTTFGFGPEAYGAAQLSGYLELHNSIYNREDLKEKINLFVKENNISEEVSRKLLDIFYL